MNAPVQAGLSVKCEQEAHNAQDRSLSPLRCDDITDISGQLETRETATW